MKRTIRQKWLHSTLGILLSVIMMMQMVVPVLAESAPIPPTPDAGYTESPDPSDGSNDPSDPADGEEVPSDPVDGEEVPSDPIDGEELPSGPIDGEAAPQQPVDQGSLFGDPVEFTSFSVAPAAVSQEAFREITTVDQIVSGGTYAILFDSAKKNILYHANDQGQTDQVHGSLTDNVLNLNTGFGRETQAWILEGDSASGFSFRSCSGTDKYLNLNAATSDGSRVPVSNDAQKLTVEAVSGGFTVSRPVGDQKLYLYHETSGTSQYSVNANPSTLRIFRQGAEEVTPPDPPAPPVDPLAIPGYTRAEGASDATKVYMIVSKDAANKLYAFYPDPAHKTADPGNSIDPNHSRGCPAGTFVAELTVNGESVTSNKGEMNALHFTLEAMGNSFAVKYGNGMYLAIADAGMLSDTPVALTVAAGSIKNDNRTLTLNVSGDPSEFTAPSGKKFSTNYWAPWEENKGLGVMLYTKDGETVTPPAQKNELDKAIETVEALSSETYQAGSWAELQTALEHARTVQQDPEVTPETIAAEAKVLLRAVEALVPVDLAPERPQEDTGITEGQPFPAGIGGSNNYRIPAITTLRDGTLAAAIDARWNGCPDGDGIDTIYTVSRDNGRTWHYSFPNFFNDSVGHDDRASAFIDPLLIQGKDGTIYLMTDLFPAGHYIGSVSQDTGYRDVGDTRRMVIYTTVNGQNGDNWTYYVGDFAGDGFAPILPREGGQEAEYYVDSHYYLYTADKKPMYCQQVNSQQYVKQNVFFLNAKLHVRNATFLWLITSTDGGEHWSAPTILNPMVRPQADGTTHRFYGVGPGAGLALSDGTVILPCYVNAGEYASFVWKNPGENVWHRSEKATPDNSSESVLVEMDVNTVRHFYRDGHSLVRYTDHVRGEDGLWHAQPPVEVPDAHKTTWNQMSAIRYKGKINGRDIILVSCATGSGNSRVNGKIYAFAINDDPGRTLTKVGEYEVNGPGVTYGYSSLTQLRDGSIGLLYEDSWIHAAYRNIPITDIIPSAVIDGKRTVNIPLYDTVEDAFAFDPVPAPEAIQPQPAGIVEVRIVDGKVCYTGLKAGQASYTYNDVTVTLNVTEPESLQNISLALGADAQRIPVTDGVLQRNTDESVVSARIETETVKPLEVPGGQGRSGSDARFTGALEPLAASLYTFTQEGNQWEIASRTMDGTDVWLKARESGHTTYPYATQKTVSALEPFHGGFSIKTGNRFLAFWKDGKNTFDSGTNANGMVELCIFYLYAPVAEGQQSSQELPGFVKVNSIENGSKYLIVAEYNGTRFVLRPSNNPNNPFSHVLKVDPTAETVNGVTRKVLVLSPLSQGTADVVADGQIYRVTCDYSDSDRTAAANASAEIEKIGTVTLASGEQIRKARDAYDALSPIQRQLVTNLQVLTDAEKAFEILSNHFEARIGETKYHTLAEALEAVQAGQTLVLLENIDLKDGSITIPADKELTLELNGKTISGTSAVQDHALITNRGSLTVQDTVGGGKISYTFTGENDFSSTKGNFTVMNRGVMTLRSGTVENLTDVADHLYAAINSDSSERNVVLNIEGGKVYTNKNRAIRQLANSTSATNDLTITGGEIVSNLDHNTVWVYSPNENKNIASTTIRDNSRVYGLDAAGEKILGLVRVEAPYGDNLTVYIDQTCLSKPYAVRSYADHTGQKRCLAKNAQGIYEMHPIAENVATVVSRSYENSMFIDYIDLATAVRDIGGYTTEELPKGRLILIRKDITEAPAGLTFTKAELGLSFAGEGLNLDGLALIPGEDNCRAEKQPDGSYLVVNYPADAQIGQKKYETLEAALQAVKPGETVTLLKDARGNGVTVPSGSSFTLDLGGHTYTIDGNLAGSEGYKSQGFQLLKDSTIIIQNGTLDAGDKAAMLIQNYSNLTLDNVTLLGGAQTNYVLSNNCGKVAIIGSTSITAAQGNVAFDVCKFSDYTIPNVTVNTTGTITGELEITGGKLEILGGNFVGAIDHQSGSTAISGGTFSQDPSRYVVLSCKVLDNENGTYTVQKADELCVIRETRQFFNTVTQAVTASRAGQTIVLLKDVTEDTVMLNKDITLDLNGRNLTSQTFVSFAGNHVVDNAAEKGKLLVSSDHILLDVTNRQFPLYVDGGYVFGTMLMQQTDAKFTDGPDGDEFSMILKPLFEGDGAYSQKEFGNGVADNKFKIGVTLSWTHADGSAAIQKFIYSDALVGSTYKADRKALSMKVTGVKGLQNLAIHSFVISETGAECVGPNGIQ